MYILSGFESSLKKSRFHYEPLLVGMGLKVFEQFSKERVVLFDLDSRD